MSCQTDIYLLYCNKNIERIQIAKTHNKIADTRKDFLHKLSTKIVSENQTIVLEDLNVSGMVKNRKLSRAISQQGWRDFRVLVEGKSEKYGRNFVVISRWEPTSQSCSECGYRWGKTDLSIRSVLCLNCGTEHDRDENASVNIEMVGMGHRHDHARCSWGKPPRPHSLLNVRRGRVRQLRLHQPMKRKESPSLYSRGVCQW